MDWHTTSKVDLCFNAGSFAKGDPVTLDEPRRLPNALSTSPQELGEWLAQWALRREKVLELLDRKAALRARVLADRCFQLARRQSSTPEPEWRRVWNGLKLEVSGFLAERRSSGVMSAVLPPLTESSARIPAASEVRPATSAPPPLRETPPLGVNLSERRTSPASFKKR